VEFWKSNRNIFHRTSRLKDPTIWNPRVLRVNSTPSTGYGEAVQDIATDAINDRKEESEYFDLV